MLLLTSPADKVRVVTGSAGAIDVHASWLDNTSGSVTPGRTNTQITTGTTTDVVAGPGAGQRNVKTMHIRNKGVTANDVTVRHFDGTITSDLYKTTIQPGETLQYIDEIGFIMAAAGVLPITHLITANATFTPTPGLVYAIIECVGGGGGGGGAASAGVTGVFIGAGGGGGGAYSKATVTAAQMGASQVVTIGLGGPGSPNSASVGSPGGNTSVGTLCLAKGGSGGSSNDASGGGTGIPLGKGGAGGVVSGALGDLVTAGSPGQNGVLGNSGGGPGAAVAVGAGGGSSFYGGGAPPSANGGTGVSTPGQNAGNYGGGGGGGFSNQSATVVAGGNGSAGVVIITEYFR